MKQILQQSAKFNLSFFARIASVIALAGSALMAPIAQVSALSFNATINKSFTPISIIPGHISRLDVIIYNSNPFILNNAAWSDNLIGVQPGIRLANPVNLVNNCGGSVTAVAGGTTLALSGGTVPAQSGAVQGSCTVSVDVTSTIPGNLVNNIPVGALTATANGGADTITNVTPANATLSVSTVLAPSLNKNLTPPRFGPGRPAP